MLHVGIDVLVWAAWCPEEGKDAKYCCMTADSWKILNIELYLFKSWDLHILSFCFPYIFIKVKSCEILAGLCDNRDTLIPLQFSGRNLF